MALGALEEHVLEYVGDTGVEVFSFSGRTGFDHRMESNQRMGVVLGN